MKNNYGMDLFQQFIHLSRYSRWLPDENRRETRASWEIRDVVFSGLVLVLILAAYLYFAG